MIKRGTYIDSGLLGSIWSLRVIEDGYLITVEMPFAEY
jgi:hypothetical protein